MFMQNYLSCLNSRNEWIESNRERRIIVSFGRKASPDDNLNIQLFKYFTPETFFR